MPSKSKIGIYDSNEFVGNRGESAYNTDYDYNYPKGLDLKPGSELHQSILTKFMERANASYEVIKNRHGDWHEMERMLTAFVPEQEVETGEESGRKRTNKTVLVPATHALMDTMLSQMVTTFLDLPIMRYSGAGGDDIIRVLKLLKVVEWQCIMLKTGLSLHTQFRDSMVYGFGIGIPMWTVHKGKRPIIAQRRLPGQQFGLFEEPEFGEIGERKLIDDILWEGTEIINVDPYKYLPDVSVPIYEPQRSERVGFISRTNYMDLLSDERDNDNGLFNIRYLNLQPFRGSAKSIIDPQKDTRDEKSGLDDNTTDITFDHPVDVIWQFIKLIPSDWGIGDGEYPEIWVIGVAGDNVIIKLEPMEYPYDSELPVCVLAPDYDGHSTAPIGKLEINTGMQNMVDFLYNSHMENVKRAVNDLLVYDPSVVNSADIMRPVPGGRVRLRRRAWGIKDVRTVLHQVPAQDFTKNHIIDASWTLDMMYRSTTAAENQQGADRRRGERVSSKEAEYVQSGVLTRLERVIRVASMQIMQDYARIYANNTQWRMSQRRWIDMTGEYEKELLMEYDPDGSLGLKRLSVGPEDIVAEYNIIPHDGSSLLRDNPQAWEKLLQIGLTQPELIMNIDGVRLYLHTLRLMGAKNVQNFRRSPTEVNMLVRNARELEERARAGEIVPANQG